MGKVSLPSVAGGGLIDRRAFLASSLRFTSVLAAATAAPRLAAAPVAGETIGTSMPIWMRTPGGTDVAYGAPSPHENIRRHPKPVTPQTAGMTSWHTPLEQLRGIITPSGLHFAIHHNGIPDIDPDKHQLMIHGRVRQPLRFDLAQLHRYPMVSRIQFLECAGNTAFNTGPMAPDASCQDLFGQASCSEWTGVPLSLLLDEAGVKDSGQWVIVEGADGGSHARSLPLSAVMKDAMIALYQNGEPLRPSQGYPMRLFMPGWEGNVNVKWVHRLELASGPSYSKDESGLYTQVLSNGQIERFAFAMDVKSVITQPSGKQTLPEAKGFYEISGLAWSGHGKISKVEVSADGGRSWAPAQLSEPVLDRAFTRFSIPWFWKGTSATLLSRATDETGRIQPTRDQWRTRYAAYSFNHYNAIQTWQVAASGQVVNVYA